MRTLTTLIAAAALGATLTAQATTKHTGTPTPEPNGLLVVKVTQNRETGQWTEREVLRICASTVTKKGPKGETIEYVAIAASKACQK